MLKLIYSLRDVHFSQLMDVYIEGNKANGSENYPYLSPEQQLIHAEQDFYAFLREFFAVDRALYAVWETGGRYVSALRMEPYKDGLLLEALETMPDQRRNGYAVKLVQAVLKTVSAEIKMPVYSHVNKHNQASLAVHAACGFERVLEYAVYIDGSVTYRCCTLRWIQD